MDQNLERHPLSAVWGDMETEDYNKLEEDIEKYGIHQPIITHEGKIIDGWHRYRAARKLQIDAVMQPMDSYLDPIAFVCSLNGKRRHLTKREVVERILACFNWKPETEETEDFESVPQPTVQQVADMAGTSKRIVQRVKAEKWADVLTQSSTEDPEHQPPRKTPPSWKQKYFSLQADCILIGTERDKLQTELDFIKELQKEDSPEYTAIKEYKTVCTERDALKASLNRVMTQYKELAAEVKERRKLAAEKWASEQEQ